MSDFARHVEEESLKRYALVYILSQNLEDDFVRFVVSIIEADIRRIVENAVSQN